MEKINLSNEMGERLLSELSSYTLNEENTKAALEKLKKILENISNESSKEDVTVAYKDARHKDKASYIYKIYKNLMNGKDLTYDDMHDIVGTRLTCLTLSDVFKVRDLINECPDIRVLDYKDYITKPKESGYRSYHMIVEVPVETETGTQYIKSEIQLRTILMDIYAREEHKIRYKGHCSEEDGIKLGRLSNSLSLYDWFLDNSFRVENKKKEIESDEELQPYKDTFESLSGFYDDLDNKFGGSISNMINDYDNKGDILHFESRIKPVESIKRKMVKRELECSTENILFNINDILGYKVVCTDLATAKDFISRIIERIENTEYLTIERKSDHLDDPKPSGYRGYKISVGYNSPLLQGKTIKFEILIRTLFMDAWALHHDIIYKDEDAKAKYAEPFKRLSDEFYGKEDNLAKIKGNIVDNTDDKSVLMAQLVEYKNSKVRKLALENKNDGQ